MVMCGVRCASARVCECICGVHMYMYAFVTMMKPSNENHKTISGSSAEADDDGIIDKCMCMCTVYNEYACDCVLTSIRVWLPNLELSIFVLVRFALAW